MSPQKILQYKELNYNDMLNTFNSDGLVSISIPSKHVSACQAALRIANYFSIRVDSEKIPLLKKIPMLTLGLFTTLRVLIFHSELLQVKVFFVLAKPSEWDLAKQNKDIYILKFYKNNKTSNKSLQPTAKDAAG